jgi:hypothetical protein
MTPYAAFPTSTQLYECHFLKNRLGCFFNPADTQPSN